MLGPAFGAAALLATACLPGSLPDLRPGCTPGATNPAITLGVACKTFWGTDERHVSATMRRRVFARYGIVTHVPCQYQIDHLISRELGGADTEANLWPEAAEPRPGYREKDRLENLLYRMMCKGLMTLPEAQEAIRRDWLGTYGKLVPPSTTKRKR